MLAMLVDLGTLLMTRILGRHGFHCHCLSCQYVQFYRGAKPEVIDRNRPFKLGPEYRKASSAFREVSIYSVRIPTHMMSFGCGVSSYDHGGRQSIQ